MILFGSDVNTHIHIPIPSEFPVWCFSGSEPTTWLVQDSNRSVSTASNSLYSYVVERYFGSEHLCLMQVRKLVRIQKD